MGFFHLPSSSNAANDVKQLVRRRAFPRAIVGCYCFADIVQNTQGGQCLQPTAIYNSYQFSAFRFQQLCLPIVNILNEPPYVRVSTTIVFCLALQQELRGYRNRSNATSATTRGLLMNHGHALGKAWLRQRWRMSISPVENEVHVSQPVPPTTCATRPTWGGLHSPVADTRCTTKSGLAPLLSIQASVLLGHSARKSVHKAEFQGPCISAILYAASYLLY